jgi:hypothetical protein
VILFSVSRKATGNPCFLFQEKATGNPKSKVAKAKGQTEGGTGVNSVCGISRSVWLLAEPFFFKIRVNSE